MQTNYFVLGFKFLQHFSKWRLFNAIKREHLSDDCCANGNGRAHFNLSRDLSLTATGSPTPGVKTSTHHVEDDEEPGHRVAPQEDPQSYAARQQEGCQNGGRI